MVNIWSTALFIQWFTVNAVTATTPPPSQQIKVKLVAHAVFLTMHSHALIRYTLNSRMATEYNDTNEPNVKLFSNFVIAFQCFTFTECWASSWQILPAYQIESVRSLNGH